MTQSPMDDRRKIAEGRARWLCMDCDVDTYANEQYYMLRPGLWRSINHKVDGMLCLACVERRLRRGLTSRDFTDARVNEGQARVCPGLAKRLAAVAPRRKRFDAGR